MHPVMNTRLKNRITTTEEAAAEIRSGMTVAMSGYAMAGYPKAVAEELVRRKQSGEDLLISLVTAANAPWLDHKLAEQEVISRRAPMCADRTLASQINQGSVRYVEQQMTKMPRLLRSKSFGKIDIAVVEAMGFDENGDLIPTTSVGMTHYLIDAADSVIVEVNRAQPEKLIGLHDVYVPLAPPHTQPVPLVRVNQRIGKPHIHINTDKIKYIVETQIPERTGSLTKKTAEVEKIVSHLFNFLELEYKTGACGAIPPIQTGFGSIANGIADAFARSNFRDIAFFCGGIGESIIELMEKGKAVAVTAGGIEMSDRVERVINSIPNLKDMLVLRNGDLVNNAEVIGRLGLLALNSGIEVDIYGNVNSSHIGGSRVVNGIGGGANFAQNAQLSIMLLPSTGKDGAISHIVPMVSHCDICEHDVDILITEHGIADLRGRDDLERADAIIANCADGKYKAQLRYYLDKARKECGGHHPQLPMEAFAWYQRLKETGTMLEDLV